MQLDAEKLLENAIRDAMREAAIEKLKGYNSPLDKMLAQAIETNSTSIRGLLTEALSSAVKDADFRDELTRAVRHNLSKTLIQRFGGGIEKQVNVLKSDPATRARITLAIEQIVAEQIAK